MCNLPGWVVLARTVVVHSVSVVAATTDLAIGAVTAAAMLQVVHLDSTGEFATDSNTFLLVCATRRMMFREVGKVLWREDVLQICPGNRSIV